MDVDTPVAIAGAGPVGLSLALGLAKAGVRSIVLEKEAGLPPHSRAAVCWPRTVEIFRSWGVAETIKAGGIVQGVVTPTITETSRRMLTLDFRPLARESLEPLPVFIPQDRTEALLYDAVVATGLSDVRFTCAVLGATQDDGGVTVHVRDTSGAQRDVRASFLVGADGGHSAVRASIGEMLDGETYKVRMLLADVSIPDDRDALPWPRIALSAPGLLFTLRWGVGQWRLISTLPAEAVDAAAVTHDAIAPLVKQLLGPGTFDIVWASVFQIHRRCAPRFVNGRIAIAGDAAHLNSPAGGQGMNAGIADAQNLAWKLVAALAGGDVTALLASYESERRAEFKGSVERFTDRVTRLVVLTSPRLRTFLAACASLVFRLPGIADKMRRTAGMMNTRYVNSPIIVGKGKLLGVRAPDRELVCAGVATLVLCDVPQEVAAAAGMPGIRVQTVNAAAAGTWRMRAPFAALVRPDGFIGWIAASPTAADITKNVRIALGGAR
jgi:2-polyprenyl-6-methoxyphenol hydroxylase-like FAD-dependent oxidoreductase